MESGKHLPRICLLSVVGARQRVFFFMSFHGIHRIFYRLLTRTPSFPCSFMSAYGIRGIEVG